MPTSGNEPPEEAVRGTDRQDAATLGTLINTKGLSEIIMLTLGRDAGLIDNQLFTALTATVLVNPLVRHLPGDPTRPEPDAPIPARHRETPHSALELSDDHGVQGVSDES
ncbi:hypothetical protein ACMATS_34140 [Streptoverticillium reticulum]|uniref:hypothetical protein n=1 Tax=Streptoverticillium reticulum TaxID=1433415 RepID=UPI0039BEE66C